MTGVSDKRPSCPMAHRDGQGVMPRDLRSLSDFRELQDIQSECAVCAVAAMGQGWKAKHRTGRG